MKRVISEQLLSAAYSELNNLPCKGERKAFVQKYTSLLGISDDRLYREFRKIKKGLKNNVRSDKGKLRVCEESTAKQDMLVLAGMKYQTAVGRKTGGLATETLIDIAYDSGFIKQKYSRSTADRLMSRYKINTQSYQKEVAAVSLIAECSNHVWFVDATPADQYFLGKSNKIIHDKSFFKDTSHADDRLRKYGFQKIWIYASVDLYSKAYNLMAFAGEHLGENTLHWTMFCKYAMQNNKKNLFCGIPRIIYSDRGSGLTSGAFARFARYFGISLETHLPGNPRAKGAIESRLGAVKSKFEKKLNILPYKISTIEELNEYLQNECYNDNLLSGKTALWRKGLQGELLIPTDAQISMALSKPFTKKVTKYGTIVIDKKHYFVDWDEVGSKVDVMVTLNGMITAENPDGKIFICEEGKKEVVFETYHGVPKSEERVMRAEAIAEGARIKKLITIGDIKSPETNITPLPVKSKDYQSGGLMPEYKTTEEAWLYVCHSTGIYRGDLPEDILEEADKFLESAISLFGFISAEQITKLTNLIKEGLCSRKESIQ